MALKCRNLPSISVITGATYVVQGLQGILFWGGGKESRSWGGTDGRHTTESTINTWYGVIALLFAALCVVPDGNHQPVVPLQVNYSSSRRGTFISTGSS